ncbi:MAG: RsmE family RNA methyltransferase [Verrucomicrobiota bacterium]
MNLLLVDEYRDHYEFGGSDPRTEKILRINSSEICIGVVNGPRGIGCVDRVDGSGVLIRDISWEKEPPLASGISLWVGLPRPADLRRILVSASSLVVREIVVVQLDQTPPGYAQSDVLSKESVQEHMIAGLEQGFHTILPRFSFFESLERAEETLNPLVSKFVLDPYLGTALLGESEDDRGSERVLFIGSERGLSKREQEMVVRSGWIPRHLGPAILRTETAVTAAIALVHRTTGFSGSAERSVIRVSR